MIETEIKAPYLLFLGDEHRATYCKTAQGVLYWQPEKCLGQLRLSADTYNLKIPDMDITQAGLAGAKSLVIGTAQIGGLIPDNWMPVLIDAAAAGLDIVSGLHVRLSSIDAISKAAKSSGAQIIDIRVPPDNIPVASGMKRPGKRRLQPTTRRLKIW